jgi:hypothetical protein
MLKVHHTQNKLAATLNLTVDPSGATYVLRNGDGAVVAEGTDLKGMLGTLAKGAPKAPKSPKAPKAAQPKKARKAAKAKRKAAKSSDEDGDDEDDPEPASVVKSKYKARYAKSELKATNDDAFAVAFHAATFNEDGELDMQLVRAVARANGVSLVKYGTSSRGWQGRQRMTLGNILRGMVRHGTDVTIGSKSFKGAKVEPKARKAKA